MINFNYVSKLRDDVYRQLVGVNGNTWLASWPHLEMYMNLIFITGQSTVIEQDLESRCRSL